MGTGFAYSDFELSEIQRAVDAAGNKIDSLNPEDPVEAGEIQEIVDWLESIVSKIDGLQPSKCPELQLLRN